MSTWYTADLHLGHTNIIRYCDRPWTDLEGMHRGLITRWNALVKPTDTVWVLGDVAMNAAGLAIASALTGNKILVAGNHDLCWAGRRPQARQHQAYLDAGFSTLVTSGLVHDHRIGQHTVMLSHLPYRGDHSDQDRYVSMRPADGGLPLIHGHVHGAWTTQGSQINVGVDVWDYRPVAEETLAALLDDLRPPGVTESETSQDPAA
jgi:calcineurin-like phosphoesterase family protein